jgi:hypothetical protein
MLRMTKSTLARHSTRALLVGAALVAALALDGALGSPAGADPRPASPPGTTTRAAARRPAPTYFQLRIGGAEAAGFFKEATGFDSESEVVERP